MIDIPAYTDDGKALRVSVGGDTIMGKTVITVAKWVRGEWREIARPTFAPHDARALAHALLECAGKPVTPVAAEGLAE